MPLRLAIGRSPMRKPDPRDLIAVGVPVFMAEAVVVVALFVGASVIVNGHTLWGVVIGWLP